LSPPSASGVIGSPAPTARAQASPAPTDSTLGTGSSCPPSRNDTAATPAAPAPNAVLANPQAAKAQPSRQLGP
jgi:hypothetical protein